MRATVLAPLQKDLDAKNTDDSSNKPAKQKISKAAAEGTLGDRNMANHLITQCPMRPVTAKERFHEVSKGALGLLQELQIINSNRFNKFIPSSKEDEPQGSRIQALPFPTPLHCSIFLPPPAPPLNIPTSLGHCVLLLRLCFMIPSYKNASFKQS